MPAPAPDPADIRAQLDRMLASDVFSSAPTSARLLRFIVETSLKGDPSALKETLIGIEVFDRRSSFDPKTDSIVRSQVGNLRNRLARYYESAGASDPVRIEIPKGAYIPEFHVSSSELQSAPASDKPPLSSPPPRRLLFALTTLLLLTIAGFLAIRAFRPPSDVGSVAVLPFLDLSPARDQEYFCDGLSEEIIDTLARIPDLRVVARTSSFAFKGKTADIREIGRSLGVTAVMEGSVRREGDRLRITAQLIRVSDGTHLWSESFDRAAGEVIPVETEISRNIASRMLGRGVTAAPRRPIPAEAHRLYLEGRYFIESSEPDLVAKALERFQQSLRLDPGQAIFWAGLADAYYYQADSGLAPPLSVMPKAKEAAQRAADLDPASAEAHTSLGIIKLHWDWDWPAAESEFRTAIRLSPGNGFIRHWLGHALEIQNKLDAAISELQAASDLDPLSALVLIDLGASLSSAGRFAAAAAVFQRAAELHPGAPFPYLKLAQTYYCLGDTARAREFMDKAPRIEDARVSRYIAATFAALRGDKDQARHVLAELVAANPNSSHMAAAYVSGLLGDETEMLDALELAYRDRDPELPYLQLLPGTSSSHPRFLRLLSNLHLKPLTVSCQKPTTH